MSIRRACSYTATFTIPADVTEYSAMLCTVAQDKLAIINKDESDLDLSGRTVALNLSQEETLLLSAGIPAQLQLRLYGGPYNAPGSRIFTVDVLPSLNEEILP